MSEEITFKDVVPVVPVRDLDAALDRYRRLGFAVHPYEGGERYGFAERGDVSLHFTEWAEHDPTRTAATVYLYVSDADALRAEWDASGVEGRLGEPRDTPYGLREFAYVDPEGTLHWVGSPAPSAIGSAAPK
jgi:catechol 2,3-dioxygenase-like lactoylglutathione lyase family enzyme